MMLRARHSLAAPALFTLLAACASSSRDSEPEATTTDEALRTEAADPTGVGPAPVVTAEYRETAAVDADVLGDRMTEVWAQMWRPETLVANHPVLVFLHGNHGTCGKGTNPRDDDSVDYTDTGACPRGYVVTPNHMGYAYLAERLASWGYVVVSVNANRGITGGSSARGDSGLNLARGRLVLRHLQRIASWNSGATATPTSLGVDLTGKLDLGNIGLLGHSRGGEGARAALAQLTDASSPWPARLGTGAAIKGIFEIGPVDGQTSRVLDAMSVAWNVLLPMCDGDVSNLSGMLPFDRMMSANNETTAAPKSMFAVWGANHNFYNTEWQDSDSDGCTGAGHTPLFDTDLAGSASQRTTGLYGAVAFFRGNVGRDANPAFAQTLDAQFAVPGALAAITRVERVYSEAAADSVAKNLEDFATDSTLGKSGERFGLSGVTATYGKMREHDKSLHVALLKWTTGGSLQVNLAPAGVDVTSFRALDFRASLARRDTSPVEPVTFGVALVDATGAVSPTVSTRDYLDLTGYGGHVVFDSARLALSTFTGVNLAKITAVRFVLGGTAGTANESLYITGIRVSRPIAAARPVPAPPPPVGAPPGAEVTTRVVEHGNRVALLRRTSQGVEVHVESDTSFPVANELATLRVGDEQARTSRYATGSLGRLVFTLDQTQFDRMQNGATVEVAYGEGESPARRWHAGVLDKSKLF